MNISKITSRISLFFSIVFAIAGIVSIFVNFRSTSFNTQVTGGATYSFGKPGLSAVGTEHLIVQPAASTPTEEIKMPGGQLLEGSGPVTREFQLLPSGPGQQFLFAGRNLLFFGSLSLVFFLLFLLFRNFGRKEYYLQANVRYLRYCVVAFIVLFLVDILQQQLLFGNYHPRKIVDGREVGQYSFPFILNGYYLLLAAGCYILTSMFSNAQKLKKYRVESA